MNIGPIHLPVPFLQAGLAGYSDRAMRTVARRRGCPYAVTEALLDTILLSGGQGLRNSIDIDHTDHPVAGQIIGSDAATMAPAARLLAGFGYDVIDLNFACPVKKIKNKARGGHMLQDVPRGVRILQAVRDALPAATLTVSLRRGFDDSAESVDRFYEIVETAWSLDYAAVRVHGRSVEQKYAGRASWPFLAEVKRRYPSRTILGSGDVFTAEDAVRMLAATGVDAVWIARGAIGNPWIFQHATQLLQMCDLSSQPRAQASGLFAAESPRWLAPAAEKELAGGSADPATALECAALQPPTIAEQRLALAEHFSLAMQIHGEPLAGRRMRKMGIKYSRFHPQATAVKREFIATSSLREWSAVLERWYAEDGPGVWPAPGAADEVNGGAAAPDLESCGVP